MRRIPTLTALISAALAVLPALSTAAASHYTVLQAGPYPAGQYKMYVIAYEGQGSFHDGIFVDFERGTPNDLQRWFYGFSKGADVDLASDGSSASIKAKLGIFGTVDMSFSGAQTSSFNVACAQTVVKGHKGTLGGRFELNTQNSVLGTVKATSLQAHTTNLTSNGSQNACKPPQTMPQTGVTQLSSTVTVSPTEFVSFTASENTTGATAGFTSEAATLIDTTYAASDGVSIIGGIDAAKLPTSVFSFAPDLSSASVNAAGSFLTGTGAYTASAPATGTESFGALGGSLTANFDGYQPVALGAGGAAAGSPGGTATLNNG